MNISVLHPQVLTDLDMQLDNWYCSRLVPAWQYQPSELHSCPGTLPALRCPRTAPTWQYRPLVLLSCPIMSPALRCPGRMPTWQDWLSEQCSCLGTLPVSRCPGTVPAWQYRPLVLLSCPGGALEQRERGSTGRRYSSRARECRRRRGA